MKKKLCSLILSFLFIGLCFATDPVIGYWISIDEKTEQPTAGWEIYEKDGKLFGEILSAAGVPADGKAFLVKASYKKEGFPGNEPANEQTVCNTPWIFNLTQDKPGLWTGGKIIDPNDGNCYKCKITYRPADGKKFTTEVLEMRGEIGLGIGRSQFWKKATKEEASSVK